MCDARQGIKWSADERIVEFVGQEIRFDESKIRYAKRSGEARGTASRINASGAGACGMLWMRGSEFHAWRESRSCYAATVCVELSGFVMSLCGISIKSVPAMLSVRICLKLYRPGPPSTGLFISSISAVCFC